ncbi:type VII secretion system-associated protein [Sciscionella sediminilitoris]|uniref:type VII secretion system-associated protein n=1 Tax=Sciscionella sediminilitoris TaxID=1445613 RepID=UPI000690ADB5|nr:type VII secretion system-associated protein [Sciscionella sp. SE31]
MSNPGPVTPAMRAEARRHPGGWVYAIDPAFSGAEEIPGSAVIGAYRVAEDGELTEEFLANEHYRPTLRGLGVPPPDNELEAVLQDAVTGNADDERVRQALREATVIAPVRPGTTEIALFEDGSDREVLHVFSSRGQLPSSELSWLSFPVRALLPAIRERYLVVNPHSRFGLRLPGEKLALPD